MSFERESFLDKHSSLSVHYFLYKKCAKYHDAKAICQSLRKYEFNTADFRQKALTPCFQKIVNMR